MPKSFFPKGSDAQHFDRIKAHRDKVYAHTDDEGGRFATRMKIVKDGEHIYAKHTEGWKALNRAVVPDFTTLCERTEDAFHQGAVIIQMMLDGEIPAKAL